jgi:hypothetical protein
MSGTNFDGGVGPIEVSVPISATANATATTGVFASGGSWEVSAIEVAFHTIPASGGGTVTIAISNRDASAAATDNLLSTATYDLETLTNLIPTAMTLSATAADLVLADGDFIFAQIVSDNADMTGGVGGVLRVLLSKVNE